MITLLIQLFYVFFKIGLFGFGGGYAMLSMIQFETVEHYAWLTVNEFTDIVAISQITPGPIAINSATYIGYSATHGSIIGSAIATFGVCLPSIIIMYIFCKFFMKFRNNKYIAAAFNGMKPAAIGLIAAAALLMINANNFIDWKSYAIFAAAFIASYFFKLGTIKLIVLAGIAGYFLC